MQIQRLFGGTPCPCSEVRKASKGAPKTTRKYSTRPFYTIIYNYRSWSDMCWWYQAVYSEFVIASEACPREQPHKHMLNFVPDSRVTTRNIDNALTIHTWHTSPCCTVGICRMMGSMQKPSSIIFPHPTKKLVGWLQGWDPMHKALLLWAALFRSTLGIPESCGNWAIAKQTSCGIHVQQQTMVTIKALWDGIFPTCTNSGECAYTTTHTPSTEVFVLRVYEQIG